uniref:Uncharacterized protein n=1 Tax=Knipowitschia caucasica TaxID=637954 RepID=A0AAV2KMB1_KNICA
MRGDRLEVLLLFVYPGLGDITAALREAEDVVVLLLVLLLVVVVVVGVCSPGGRYSEPGLGAPEPGVRSGGDPCEKTADVPPLGLSCRCEYKVDSEHRRSIPLRGPAPTVKIDRGGGQSGAVWEEFL